jgi:hypothetical protein
VSSSLPMGLLFCARAQGSDKQTRMASERVSLMAEYGAWPLPLGYSITPPGF